mgnify:CR=1 FL=1
MVMPWGRMRHPVAQQTVSSDDAGGSRWQQSEDYGEQDLAAAAMDEIEDSQ